ncbi:MAG: glycosyltransferase family 39 protein [Patescibacteria group bacterium]|jgi:4-amino-4-deoxy-L-arabinose transferase-like glycosyltransferase
MNKKLLLILLLALFIRVIGIANFPSLNPDEAAIGYNDYSLLLTGQDEHGTSWPLHFKSFGDYKPGGYFYLALPFIALGGLNTFSVRLPNIILSVISLFFLYRIVLILTKNNKLSLITLFIAAVNPWLIHFGRGAWESSAALSLIIIGTYFFLRSLKTNISTNFLLFSVFYVSSLYTYHSARIVAPLLAFALVLPNVKYYLSNFKKVLLPTILAFFLCLPVAVSFLNNGGTTRFSGVGITADQGPFWRANELIGHHPLDSKLPLFIHNSKIQYSLSWLDKYTSHFNPSFLFSQGDEVPRSKVPNFGQFYLLELIPLLIGIHLLFSKKYYRPLRIILIPWLLIAPLASSLTFQAPSALRSLPLSIPIIILVSMGIYHLTKDVNIIGKFFVFLLYTISFSYFLFSYFYAYPKIHPTAWNSGFKELNYLLETKYEDFDHVYITNKYDQPYIYFLFFNRYPPINLHSEIQLTTPDQYGFQTVPSFGKYIFGPINWAQIPQHSLVVAADESIPQNPLDIIYFDNFKPAFKIYSK